MSKSPSPESSSHTFLKFLALGFPLLVLAGLIACGGSSVTHLSTGGGGGGGGGSRTVNDMLFAADFNKIASNPKGWCPTDSAGNVAAVTTLRIWDSGMKWANIETAPGVYDWSKMDHPLRHERDLHVWEHPNMGFSMLGAARSGSLSAWTDLIWLWGWGAMRPGRWEP